MGEHTGITWCDHTFNYVWGCSEVAPECDECYAREWAKRMGFDKLWSGEYRILSDAYWKEPLKWARKSADAGVRRRVFTSSMADVFDMAGPESERARLFNLIKATPELDWLLLTKRPGQARTYLKSVAGWPWRNVWLGISAGTQKSADAFIPILQTIPAYIRWISHEPALEQINWLDSSWSEGAFGLAYSYSNARYERMFKPVIGWVVSGGESGDKARSIPVSFLADAQYACETAMIPWFCKQMGTRWAHKHYKNGMDFKKDSHGKLMSEWPERLRIQQFPA